MNPNFNAIKELFLFFYPVVNSKSFELFKIVVFTLMTRICSDASVVQFWRWMSPDCHWTNIPRFVRSHKWSVWRVAMALLKLILKMFAGDGDLYVVADTTDVERYTKTLPCVFKMWCTKLGRYIFGQCWMVLGILVKCPGGFLCMGFLPILWDKNMKRTDMLKKYLEALSISGRKKYLIADSYFSCVFAEGWHLITRLKINSALFEKPPARTGKRGAPRKKGGKIFLENILKKKKGWKDYQYRGRDIEYFTLDLIVRQWDNRLARIIVCRFKQAKSKDRAMILAGSDLEMSAETIIDLYGGRFEIEVMFQEIKTNCGFGKYRGSTKDGHEKMAMLVLVAQTFMQIMRLKFDYDTKQLNMPWYNPKKVTPNLLRKLLSSCFLTGNIFELAGKYTNSTKIHDLKEEISLHIAGRI